METKFSKLDGFIGEEDLKSLSWTNAPFNEEALREAVQSLNDYWQDQQSSVSVLYMSPNDPLWLIKEKSPRYEKQLYKTLKICHEVVQRTSNILGYLDALQQYTLPSAEGENAVQDTWQSERNGDR